MAQARVTRGYGVLEEFLARQRTRRANRLITPGCPRQRVLDVGCGNQPYFLAHTDFVEKYGLDRVARDDATPKANQNIRLVDHDVQSLPLPFDDDYFDVVTMLAVLEHLPRNHAGAVFSEIRRVLRPGGECIITTPAPWAEMILRMMAWLRLISPEEIREHRALYGHRQIAAVLEAAGFAVDTINGGSFELGMNLWATSRK